MLDALRMLSPADRMDGGGLGSRFSDGRRLEEEKLPTDRIDGKCGTDPAALSSFADSNSWMELWDS